MHHLKYDVTNYTNAAYAHLIHYECTCGIKGVLTDGQTAPTRKHAKIMHDRKVLRLTK